MTVAAVAGALPVPTDAAWAVPDPGTRGRTEIQVPVDGARTMFEFHRGYTGADKQVRQLNSHAVGWLNGNCTGAMVSPHLFMTAAHCGGPGWSGSVRFLSLDEDAARPGPAAQQWGPAYHARVLPWQSFGTATGGGDTVLWQVSNGPDGVAPGVRHGMVELSETEVAVGDEAYSLWGNPVERYDGQRLDWTILHSAGRATARQVVDWRGPTTDYSIYGAPGGSGSPIFGGAKHGHRVIGVTSCGPSPEGGSRCAADTTHFVRQHDAERNAVLDAIEYDWLLTEPTMPFRLDQFDTAPKRAQWVPFPNGGGSIGTESGTWAAKATATTAPADSLWHRTARFLPRTTYRFSAVVRGTTAGASGFVKLRGDGGPADPSVTLTPGTAWARVTGRFTTGDSPNHRFVLGANAGSTVFFRDVAITQESAAFTFDSGEERRTWETAGSSHLTSWGVADAHDFSGVVAGPVPATTGWGLRNRYVALRPHRTYELTFTARHVTGAPDQAGTFAVQDLGGVVAGRHSWAFTSAGQRLDRRVVVTTTGHAGHTVVFGGGALTYLVDNLRIREL
ncbi:hypothetical protein GCM10009557_69750 [Virgisporangium ochraceum]|uniref:Serine protease n=1 Tax=Virgisporangium ochraceum TaxID=65505 RepID=A0A8J4EHG5_9ACTN|nr:hypothetical protein Voc01_070940 [Virgisporangium ochraceum]